MVQARVSRILRHTDYNFKTKEPILCNPQCKVGFFRRPELDSHLKIT